KDPAPQVANNPVGLAPVDCVPVRAGPSRGSVCSSGVLHLTCPSVSFPYAVLRVTHQTHVSGLSAWVIGPYPPGYAFPLPFGRRPSLLGSSGARCGVGPCFRSSSGLLRAGGQTTAGVPRSSTAGRGRGLW